MSLHIKYLAIALVALVLLVIPVLPLLTRFMLLGALLIGSVIWLMPREQSEEEEREREANERRWHEQQEQGLAGEPELSEPPEQQTKQER